MTVTFAGGRYGSVLVPTGTGFTARTPTTTAVDDLLLMFVNTFAGHSAVVAPAGSGWVQIAGAFESETEIDVWTKRAEPGDVGGAGSYHFTFASGLDAPAWVVTAWRDAPTYTSAVHAHDSGSGLTHTVPSIVSTASDYEIIVFASVDLSAATTFSLPAFTQHTRDQGRAAPMLATFSKPAGAVGTVGPWTMTTPDSVRMSFIVLGIAPRLEVRGVVTLPYFVPLGNTPAT